MTVIPRREWWNQGLKYQLLLFRNGRYEMALAINGKGPVVPWSIVKGLTVKVDRGATELKCP